MERKFLLSSNVGMGRNTDIFEFKEVNQNSIYKNGFISNKLTSAYHRRLLKYVQSLRFKQYSMDAIDHGEGHDYSFNLNDCSPLIETLIAKVYSEFYNILCRFNEPEFPIGIEIGVCKHQKGYFVDWHQDSWNQAVLSFCLILTEDQFDPDVDGGVLQFSKLEYSETGTIKGRNLLAEFPANNSGVIVFFNPSDLNYQHRCTEIISDSKTRYLLYGVIGEIDHVN